MAPRGVITTNRNTQPPVNLRNVPVPNARIAPSVNRNASNPLNRTTSSLPPSGNQYLDPTIRAQQEAQRTTFYRDNPAAVPRMSTVGLGLGSGLEEVDNAFISYDNVYKTAPGGTGGGGLTFEQRLAQQKFDYDKRQDRLQRQDVLEAQKYERDLAAQQTARTQAGAQAQYADLQRMLASGSTDYEGMRNLLNQQQQRSEQDVQSQYANALREIQSRQATAQGLTTQGFDALGQAIRNAPPGAFTAAERATAPQITPDVTAQFAELSGLAPVAQAIQGTVAEQQAAATNEVAAYNRALDFLAREEQNAQTSRALEADMARTLANAQLQVLYGGEVSGLEGQRLQALADIYNQIQAQRFGISQAELARKQQLQDAMNAVLGTGFIDITGGSAPSGTGSAPSGTGGNAPSGAGNAPVGTEPIQNLPLVPDTVAPGTVGDYARVIQEQTAGQNLGPSRRNVTSTPPATTTTSTTPSATVTPPAVSPAQAAAQARIAEQQRAENQARLEAQRRAEIAAQQQAENQARLEAQRRAEIAAQQRAEGEARLQAQRRAEIEAQQRAENAARAAAAERAAQQAAAARIAQQQAAENAARAAAAQRAAAVTSASKPSSGSKATRR